MANRLDLQTEFETILGSRNVYFQPPASVLLKYPCIVYSRSGVNKLNADDRYYMGVNEYEVTVIDHDPDSEISDEILKHFPMCTFDRPFTSDNLNHWVLTLYY